MQILTMLMPLLGIVAFVGFVWLLVVAFKQNVLWGIGVLLLSPITAIIFAIKYWQESKKPFLIYMGSSMASLAILVMVFSSLGGFEILGMARRAQQGEEITEEETIQFMEATMDRMENSGLLSDQDKAELEQMRQKFDEIKTESAGTEPSPSAPTLGSTLPSRTASASETPAVMVTSTTPSTKSGDSWAGGPKTSPTGHIAVSQARHFVGKNVRVLDHNGHAMKGMLTDTRPSAIVLTKYLMGGTITYEVRTSEIESLQVLRY